nr:low molecular weight phosphatase family protein [Mycolicibacterium gilvum]
MHVLFVCTGNICRSPIAERLATALATQLKIPDFTSSSAGVRAVIGHPIHPEAALVLESLGGDASAFVARQFIPRIGSQADLIITMSAAHRDAVLERAPRLLARTFTLAEVAEFASGSDSATIADLPRLRVMQGVSGFGDVPDPIGLDSEAFDAVGTKIAASLPPILELCQRSGSF